MKENCIISQEIDKILQKKLKLQFIVEIGAFFVLSISKTLKSWELQDDPRS